MKKLLFVLILSSLIVVRTYSQWTTQSSGTTETLNGIDFTNQSTGYICGNAGIVLKTTNAGANWNVQNTSHSQDLVSISVNPGNPNYIIAVGRTSQILLSTDAGTSWNGITFAINAFYKVKHADIFTVYAVGTSGKVIKSTTAGATWNVMTVGSVSFLSLAVLSNSTVIAAGMNGNMYKTTNGGLNWNPINSGVSSSYNITDLYFSDQNTGYLLVNNGGIFKTINGGSNWFSFGQVLVGPVGDHLLGGNGCTSIIFEGSNVYVSVAIGADGLIAKSFNGGSGSDWYALNITFLHTAPAMFFTDNATGYAAGGLGNIYKTTNAGGDPIGIQPVSNQVPNEFSLSQNYPNPFNPTTKIEFNISHQSFVRLGVFDIMGRKVTELVNENLNAGVYKVDFDAGALPSGVYYYKIQTDAFSETKKMILLK